MIIISHGIKKSLFNISLTKRLYGNYEALDGGQISNVIEFLILTFKLSKSIAPLTVTERSSS